MNTRKNYYHPTGWAKYNPENFPELLNTYRNMSFSQLEQIYAIIGHVLHEKTSNN